MSARTTFINSLLNAAFKGQTYTGGTITIKLFKTGLPSTTGVELSGGSYAAQTLTFTSAASKVITAANVTFTNLPTGSSNTVVAWGVYDGATLIDEGTFTTPFTADITSNSLTTGYSFSLSGS